MRQLHLEYVIEYSDQYIVTLKRSESINTIIKIDQLQQKEEYVYDLETECGWFNAGIGDITLKNTDSVYFRPR